MRRQHALELGAYLIKLAMDSQGDPVGKLLQVCAQIEGMMMQPESPLDASWLAAHVMSAGATITPANIQQCLNEQQLPAWGRGIILRMWLYTQPPLSAGHSAPPVSAATQRWRDDLLKRPQWQTADILEFSGGSAR